MMNDNNKVIERLNDELELYDMNIEDDHDDANSYFMKAGVLVKLATHAQGNGSYYDQALDCYNKAIELEGNNPLYLADRAKLYINNLGNANLAAVDIKTIEALPQACGVTGIYITNTVADISKLDGVKGVLQNLENLANGEASPNTFVQNLQIQALSEITHIDRPSNYSDANNTDKVLAGLSSTESGDLS